MIKFLLVGCDDNTIKVIDLKNEIVLKDLTGHNHRVITIQTIFHPKYGDCIISQGWANEPIKIWINKKWNKIYIITCNYNSPNLGENIKIFDIYGKKLKDINNSQ